MILDAIRQAQQMHRKILEETYDGFCWIYEYQKGRDEKTKLTKSREVLVKEKIPCHLSYSSMPPAAESEAGVERQQAIRLFLAPEVVIKAGSKLVVVQNGMEKAYRNSGEPAYYVTHQELLLELFERWT